jgi:Zn-dependent M28 family amino/carboxypeptidase
VQGRNLVVEGIAALVEAAQVLRHRRLDEGAIHGRLAGGVGRRANLFKH